MSGGFRLDVLDAVIGDIMAYEEDGEIGYWKINGFAEWQTEPERDGIYDVYMLASCGDGQGGDGVIETSCGRYAFTVYMTASFSSYHYIRCENVRLNAGRQSIKILPVRLNSLFFMNLKEIIFVPAGEKFAAPILTQDIPRSEVPPADDVLDMYSGKAGKELYKYRIDKMLEEYDRSGGKKVTWPGGLWHGLAILCRSSAEEQYLARVVKKAEQWINIFTRTGKLPQYNFASKIGIIELLEAAEQSGKLSEEQIKTAEDMIRTLLINSVYEGGGVMNRNIGYCLGLVGGFSHIKAMPEYELLRKMTDSLDYELEQTCEPLENSTNYEDITLMFMINYIEKAGLDRLYSTEKMRNTFYSLLSKITPDGGLSSYGDYGGKEKYSILFAAVFEAAAGIYSDGRFKYAAEQICRRLNVFRTDPAQEQELDGWDFLGLAHAYEWCDDSVDACSADSRSCVLHRNDGQLDKAVFCGGGLFMLMDFVNGCEHGCNNTLGIMSVVRDGKNALFDMGHRDEANHAKIIVRRSDGNFPKAIDADSDWQEGTIRLSNYWSWGVFNDEKKRYHSSLKNGINDMLLADCSADYDPEKEFLLAVLEWRRFQIPYRDAPKSGRAYIKNLRLVRPDGSEAPLCDKSGWYGKCSFEGDTVQIDIDGAKVPAAKVFKLPLDIRGGEYEYLKFDIKTESLPVKELMFTIGDNTYYPHNYPMFLNPMNTARELYFRQNEFGTAAGFELENRDSRQKREIAFVNGLGIRIKDTVTVKTDAKLSVGSIWRFDELKKITDTTYLTKSDCEMYISFLEVPDTLQDGINIHESEEKRNKYVLYNKRRGNGTYTFDTLLHFDTDAVFDSTQTVIGGICVRYAASGFEIVKK